jgi:hypothetical protein
LDPSQGIRDFTKIRILNKHPGSAALRIRCPVLRANYQTLGLRIIYPDPTEDYLSRSYRRFSKGLALDGNWNNRCDYGSKKRGTNENDTLMINFNEDSVTLRTATPLESLAIRSCIFSFSYSLLDP